MRNTCQRERIERTNESKRTQRADVKPTSIVQHCSLRSFIGLLPASSSALCDLDLMKVVCECLLLDAESHVGRDGHAVLAGHGDDARTVVGHDTLRGTAEEGEIGAMSSDSQTSLFRQIASGDEDLQRAGFVAAACCVALLTMAAVGLFRAQTELLMQRLRRRGICRGEQSRDPSGGERVSEAQGAGTGSSAGRRAQRANRRSSEGTNAASTSRREAELRPVQLFGRRCKSNIEEQGYLQQRVKQRFTSIKTCGLLS